MSHVTRIYLPHISMSHVTYVQPIAFEVWSNSNLLSQPHEEGMEAKLERKKIKRFVGTQPKKRTGPGQMAQAPRAGTGVSACKSCVVGAQLCLLAMAIFPCVVLSCALTLISVYYCQPQKRERGKKNRKENSSIWSFRIPTAIFCTKNWCNLGLLPTPLHGSLFNVRGKSDLENEVNDRDLRLKK